MYLQLHLGVNIEKTFFKLHAFRDIPIGGASRGQHMQAMYVEMRLVVVSRRPVLEFGLRNDDYDSFGNNV